MERKAIVVKKTYKDEIMISENPIKLDINKSKSDKKLHDYQQEAIEKLEKSLITNKRKAGILQIPTGGGKTYTAVYWLFNSLMHKGYKLVWIAHRIDLLEQAITTMNEESYLLKGLPKNPKAIIIGGGYSSGMVIANAKEEILLLSFQTLAKNNGQKALISYCKKNKNNKILFIIDEAHHSAASTYSIIIKRDIEPNPNFKLLGLTATPTRTVEKERTLFWNLFDNNKIFEIDINKLIKDKKLSTPIAIKASTRIKIEEAFEISDETRKYFETRHELDPAFLTKIGEHAARNQIIVDTYITNKTKYGKTLVFAIDKAHCITLNDEFSKHKNIRVDYTFSGKDGHSEIIERFKNDKLDVLINVSKLTEGFDDPKIQTVFLTRPTQSEILFSQMIGRGLRGGPNGTKEAFLVSFEDHWDKFTGWLDSNRFLQLAGIEIDEKGQKIPKPKSYTIIPYSVIEDLYRQIRVFKIPVLTPEYWPIGWYTIEIEDEGDIETSVPTKRTILVFSHQKQSWDELCASLSKQKPTLKERTKIYNNWFDDIPTPTLSKEVVNLFIDSCYVTGSFIQPVCFTLKEREEASPNKLADKLYKESVGGKKRYDAIAEWYNKYELLQDLYNDLTTFTEMVDKAERDISVGLVEKPKDYGQFLSVDKIKVIIPETDNKKLYTVFDSLKSDKRLFPNGYLHNPSLEWTHRVMKSYFGMAYLDEDLNRIKINKLLNSPDIENSDELLKFVMYHEMLHFTVSRFHGKEFRAREEQYPNIVEIRSCIYRIGIEYGIDGFNK